ncbi:hypothetical protein M8J76_010295 [Diaphorina citri]|nr:hypothetical protein M8J76_010295 [Diaphorina citri]
MYPDNQVYKYIDQLEKRVLEQEQLIALLNEKILSLKSTPQVNQPNAADVRSPTSCNVPPRDQNMDQMSFVGTRKSDVPSVTTTKYNQYFVSRVGPDTSAEVLSKDLIANVPALTSVKCCKMKSRHPSYASFHVVIPSDQNELVETEDAWPEGSFVKKFSGRLLDSYILETFESKDADTTRYTAPSPVQTPAYTNIDDVDDNLILDPDVTTLLPVLGGRGNKINEKAKKGGDGERGQHNAKKYRGGILNW